MLLEFSLTFYPFIPFHLELKKEQYTNKNNHMKWFLNSEVEMLIDEFKFAVFLSSAGRLLGHPDTRQPEITVFVILLLIFKPKPLNVFLNFSCFLFKMFGGFFCSHNMLHAC